MRFQKNSGGTKRPALGALALILALALALCGCSAGGAGKSAAASDSTPQASSEEAAGSPAPESTAQSAASAAGASEPASGTEAGSAPAESLPESTAEPASAGSAGAESAAEPPEVTVDSADPDHVIVTFSRLPQNAAELEALDKSLFLTPQYAAAVFVAAMCRYPDAPDDALAMVEYANGPETLSDYDLHFLADRMQGKPYKPFSYFAGASPDNDYVPDVPYVLEVDSISNTWDEDGYARFVMTSSGADSARPITVRQKKSTGEWFLWEEGLLADMRVPASQDAWG